eukprot:scaffold141551_cov30-Tisochrysis_lutea.AAC.1
MASYRAARICLLIKSGARSDDETFRASYALQIALFLRARQPRRASARSTSNCHCHRTGILKDSPTP